MENLTEESKRNIDRLEQNLNSIVKNTYTKNLSKKSEKKHDNKIWQKATCTSCIIKHCQNNTRFLNINSHNAAKKCHNLTKKCHAMTSSACGNDQKTQGQSVGYVKVRFSLLKNSRFVWILVCFCVLNRFVANLITTSHNDEGVLT